MRQRWWVWAATAAGVLSALGPVGNTAVVRALSECHFSATYTVGGRPVPGAEVRLVETGSLAITDGQGRFSIDIPGQGTWTVVSIGGGATPFSRRIEVGTNCRILSTTDTGGSVNVPSPFPAAPVPAPPAPAVPPRPAASPVAAAPSSNAPTPIPPSRFLGSLTLDGAPPPPGTIVTAEIGGVACGRATVTPDGRYTLDVASGTQTRGCGAPGATVRFRIGDLPANETGVWALGQFITLNLSAASPAPPAPATTTAPATAVELVLSDSFDETSGVLQPVLSSRFVAAYEDGEFLIRIVDPAFGAGGATVPGTFTDATIAVTARLVDDALGRYILVTCRRSDSGNYRLSVDPQAGTFSVSRFDGSTQTTLLSRTSPAIRRGTQANRIELSCIGSTITARINGATVGSVEDTTYTEGQFRIGAGSYSNNPLAVEARFEDLAVTRPAPPPPPVEESSSPPATPPDPE